jgi:hypothetical protein
MSFAIRGDGLGWRAVNSPDEVSNGEIYSKIHPSLTFLRIKCEKSNAIKSARDRRSIQGGYMVGEKWFHSDPKSRSQQYGLVLLGTNIPENLQWKTMDGSFVTMNQQLAQQIISAARVSDQAIFSAAELHKFAMQTSADPASYDFSTGWPKAYWEYSH